MSDIQDNIDAGAQTIGEALGYDAPVTPVTPPRLGGAPEFPAPGIYFNMPEDEYHAIHSGSSSGLKRLSVSSMDYWANSVLNAEPEEEEDKKDRKYLDLGKVYHTRIVEGPEAYAACYAIGLSRADYPDALVTIDQIKAAIVEAGEKPKGKAKADFIAQLLELAPDAEIWERIVAAHAEANAGKVFVSALNHRRVEIAAKMIEAHPELGGIFRGGHPEVSLFWYCPLTGAPMKARIDYLKLSVIVDLKSFSNKGGMPIDRAIERTIATYRYNLQHCIYDEAVAQVKRLIRDNLAAVQGTPEQIEWAQRWAKQDVPPIFLFVFQQTGIAPVTRGKKMPRGMTFDVTNRAAERLKRKWVECANAFGVLPWLDVMPIDDIDDEAIPLFATEL